MHLATKIPKKANSYHNQHLTNNQIKKKKSSNISQQNKKIFLANIFSAYFSPSTFSPKKFSHFFHNPQDSRARDQHLTNNHRKK
jgi:hypothetical protein